MAVVHTLSSSQHYFSTLQGYREMFKYFIACIALYAYHMILHSSDWEDGILTVCTTQDESVVNRIFVKKQLRIPPEKLKLYICLISLRNEKPQSYISRAPNIRIVYNNGTSRHIHRTLRTKTWLCPCEQLNWPIVCCPMIYVSAQE